MLVSHNYNPDWKTGTSIFERVHLGNTNRSGQGNKYCSRSAEDVVELEEVELKLNIFLEEVVLSAFKGAHLLS